MPVYLGTFQLGRVHSDSATNRYNQFPIIINFIEFKKAQSRQSAETVDGGMLREAATMKNDQRILRHILDGDCVALEVKYHKRCY